ncbi:MAG: herpeto-tandem family RiPP [Chloroflexi bacterium]|nr:herpeto-tandem family RiPP [Chloroflexota bacterium]
MNELQTNILPTNHNNDETAIFGLRYLEEEAAEIHDIIGCQTISGTCTACSDDGESGDLQLESA